MNRSRAVLVLFAMLPFFVSGTRREERPSIVLVSVDTLRADHIGVYGGGATSPYLDSLAARGLVFDRAFVPFPQTSASHASMLTSVNPWKHGVVTNGLSIGPNIDTLAAALKRAGYETAGAVAVGHLSGAFGFARGFDRFTEPLVVDKGDNRRDADAVNADAFAAIDAHVASHNGKPLFLFVHYFDCHYPYRWWDRNEKKTDPWTESEQLQTNKQLLRYDDGVRHIDDRIRQLHERLSLKLGPNVVFVVTADHGEQIGDHGLAVGHANIYRETVRVPLIVAGPTIGKGRVGLPVSTMDIGVTLTKLAGARFAGPVEGRDLTETAEKGRSWLRRLLPNQDPRQFVVFGFYTRSLALIRGNLWFILNFDALYRSGWVSRTPAATGAVPEAGPAQETNVPFRQFRPYYVTIEHHAKNDDCVMGANVIAPGVPYWTKPLVFRKSIRLVVPSARFDLLTFAVSPARCAGTTTFHAVRPEELAAATMAADRMDLDMWNILVNRKLAAGDELYDVSQDPQMGVNLVGKQETAPFDRNLETLFREMAATAATPNRVVPPEEVLRLRALGYLQ